MPDRDAGLVIRLREAGAVVLGKTNLTELANFMAERMPSGYSSLGGQVLNPYDVSLTPCGSSVRPVRQRGQRGQLAAPAVHAAAGRGGTGHRYTPRIAVRYGFHRGVGRSTVCSRVPPRR